MKINVTLNYIELRNVLFHAHQVHLSRWRKMYFVYWCTDRLYTTRQFGLEGYHGNQRSIHQSWVGYGLHEIRGGDSFENGGKEHQNDEGGQAR